MLLDQMVSQRHTPTVWVGHVHVGSLRTATLGAKSPFTCMIPVCQSTDTKFLFHKVKPDVELFGANETLTFYLILLLN